MGGGGATSSSLNQAVRGAAYAAPVSPDLPDHGTAGVLPARTVRLLTPHASASPPIPARTVLYLRWVAYGLILVLSACLEFIGLDQEGYANTYYAAGVKSMLTSWHNFFYVSFDSGGFVTLDKSPLGLWIQAASAKLFGLSGLSLLAPEALAGCLSCRPAEPVRGTEAPAPSRPLKQDQSGYRPKSSAARKKATTLPGGASGGML